MGVRKESVFIVIRAFGRVSTSVAIAVLLSALVGPPARSAQPPAGYGSNEGVFATDGAGAHCASNGPAGVAAEVDGHKILLRDVQATCLRKYRSPIVDQMVQNYVLERECAKKGIVVTEAEIDKEVENLRKTVAPQPLEDVIALHHSSMDDVRASYKHKIQRSRIVADQVAPVGMTHCRGILIKYAPVGVPAMAAGTARTEALALALIHNMQAELLHGTPFGALAEKYSEASPKKSGGDIGVIFPGIRDTDGNVIDEALALDKGKVSIPVRARDGYWLLQAISTSKDHDSLEDDLYKAAQDAYVVQQTQFLSPKYVADLIEKSHITFATDAECDPAPGKELPEAAAAVDGHVVPMKDVVAKCLADSGPRVVDILVQNYIVDDECKKRNITISASAVDQRLDTLRKLIAPHTLDEGLQARHMTLDELRYTFTQEMERARLVIDQVKPAGMAHCRAIFVKFQQVGGPTDPNAKLRSAADALALITDIQGQLRNGKSFGALADKYSALEPRTANGDLGILYPAMNDMDTALLKAGLGLSTGQITPEPIKSVNGYGLVQCVSTSFHHAGTEDGAYGDALQTYKERAAQPLIPTEIVELIKKRKVVYYVHA
jgi:foldase protein PrsA